MPATQLVIKCQIPGVITTFGVLPQDTVKGSWEEKKRQHSTFTASYSVSYQVSNTWVSQVITTFGVLPQDTVKGSWEEKKRQHSTFTAYLSRALGERASKTLFPRVGDRQVLHAAQNFFIISV